MWGERLREEGFLFFMHRGNTPASVLPLIDERIGIKEE